MNRVNSPPAMNEFPYSVEASVTRSSGILLIAFGESYRNEARRSLASLKRCSPSIRTAVVTDSEWVSDPRPDQFIIRQPVAGFASKPAYIRESPFDDTLFVDTDTVFARDVKKIFGLLRHFDIGVTFEGPQLNEPDGLELHTQCSSGVILFRKSSCILKVFENWLKLHSKASADLIGRHRNDLRGLNDQRYLAIAIARSRVRPVHLAAYLQFVLFTVATTYSPPIIYHGRGHEAEFLDSYISKKWNRFDDCQPRVWLPNIRGLLPMGIRRSDPLLAIALALRRLLNEVRWLAVPWHRRSKKAE